MLATSMVAACAVTQSMPQMIDDHDPAPCEVSTRTAHSRAPGATPTTPLPLSRAPTVPATWVPWPLRSLYDKPPATQLTPPTTLRSRCLVSMPVSMIATSTSTAPRAVPGLGRTQRAADPGDPGRDDLGVDAHDPVRDDRGHPGAGRHGTRGLRAHPRGVAAQGVAVDELDLGPAGPGVLGGHRRGLTARQGHDVRIGDHPRVRGRCGRRRTCSGDQGHRGGPDESAAHG